MQKKQKEKKKLSEKAKKNSEWYYKTKKMSRQNLCQEKETILEVNGHRAVLVNTTFYNIF